MDARIVERAMQTDEIEIAPLAFMRGRTLVNAVVILDEAQNTTSMQMKMFLTRLGENSRMIVTGDPSQVDLPPGQMSGLAEAMRLLAGVEGIGHVDVHRGGRGPPRTGRADRRGLRQAALGASARPANDRRRDRTSMRVLADRCRSSSRDAAGMRVAGRRGDGAARAQRGRAARCGASVQRGRELAVVLTDDAAIRDAQSRSGAKIDKPTNVLSFPAAGTRRCRRRHRISATS